MAHSCITDCLNASFQAHGDKPAVCFLRRGRLETTLTYADLDAHASRMTGYFKAAGVGKADRVILFLPKSIGFLIAHLALLRLGAVSVPVNPGFRQEEMAYLVKDTRPALILAGTSQARILESVDPELDIRILDTDRVYQEIDLFQSYSDDSSFVDLRREDPGTIIYTSGTTGQPKGAVLTQGNLAHDAKNIIDIWKITRADRICHALPLFHVHGLCFAAHTALMVGATLIMHDRFAPEQVIETLAVDDPDRRCTIFMAVPSMYIKMLEAIGDAPAEFEHVRLWASGSAPLLSKDFERIRKVFGKAPVEREGMSETGMNFSNPLSGPKKPGSIGLPLPQLEVRIISTETGQTAPAGQTGEIWLRGPGITPGYWRKPKETEKAFHNGWFKTGDLGYADQDGYYYLTDRIKNIIISGGENISPKEIETVINRMDAVLESAVVGIPDDKWGKRWPPLSGAGRGLNLMPQKSGATAGSIFMTGKHPDSSGLSKKFPKIGWEKF
jgi:malonyl-CoA/methylmalonyl-CoA synthetase